MSGLRSGDTADRALRSARPSRGLPGREPERVAHAVTDLFSVSSLWPARVMDRIRGPTRAERYFWLYGYHVSSGFFAGEDADNPEK